MLRMEKCVVVRVESVVSRTGLPLLLADPLLRRCLVTNQRNTIAASIGMSRLRSWMDCAYFPRRSRCALAEVEALEELLFFGCLLRLDVGILLDAVVPAEAVHAGKLAVE